MLQCNCSIFGDEQTHEAIVVDPGDEIATMQRVADLDSVAQVCSFLRVF